MPPDNHHVLALMDSLKNKVALVTGASSGMGKAIAEAMGVLGIKFILKSNQEK